MAMGVSKRVELSAVNTLYDTVHTLPHICPTHTGNSDHETAFLCKHPRVVLYNGQYTRVSMCVEMGEEN